jgi:hypothetical protein
MGGRSRKRPEGSDSQSAKVPLWCAKSSGTWTEISPTATKVRTAALVVGRETNCEFSQDGNLGSHDIRNT